MYTILLQKYYYHLHECDQVRLYGSFSSEEEANTTLHELEYKLSQYRDEEEDVTIKCEVQQLQNILKIFDE